MPDPAISSISPGFGPKAGGTGVTISGVNFQDPSVVSVVVKIGGANATSVVIVDDNTITCDTPAHVDGAYVGVTAIFTLTPSGTVRSVLFDAFAYTDTATITISAADAVVTLTGPGIAGAGFDYELVPFAGAGDVKAKWPIVLPVAGATILDATVNINDEAPIIGGVQWPLFSSQVPWGIGPTQNPAAVDSSAGFASAIAFSPGVAGSATARAATAVPVSEGDYIGFHGALGGATDTACHYTIHTLSLAVVYSSHTIRVDSVTADHGPDTGGTHVTIVGEGFGEDPMLVNFDNVEATNIIVVDENTITCDTPAHVAALVDVTVTRPSNGAFGTLTDGFTFEESGFDPDMGGGAGLSPDHGTMTGGTAVTITGKNLDSGYDIFFGDTIATSIVHVSDTEYTCVTPAHVAGLVDVTVGPYTVADAFTFDPLTASEWSGFIRRAPEVSLHETAHVSGDLSFETDSAVVPNPGQDTEIDLGDGPIFDGTILSRETTFEEQTTQLVHTAAMVDFVWLLNARRPFGFFESTPADEIATALIADFAPEFTSTGVASALPSVTILFDGSKDFADCLTDLVNAMGVGGAWYLEGKDLHFFFTPEGGGTDPDTIVDSLATLMKDPPIREREDVSQVRNRIFGRGAGARTTVDANIGDDVIEVDSIDNFVESGGYAIAGANIVHYTGKARVSQAVARANAPGTASGTNISGGVVVSGSIRNNVSYKFSFVDANGKESSLSAVTRPSFAPSGFPNVQTGSSGHSAIVTLGGGAIGAGGYTYILGHSGSGSNNGQVQGNGNVDTINVSVVFGGSSVTITGIRHYDDTGIDFRISTINIWRNKSGGDVFYQVGSIPNVSGDPPFDFTDILNDASLSGPDADILDSNGPGGGGAPVGRNTTGSTVFLSGIPLGPAGTTARKIYRAEDGQPDVYTLLTTISDNVTTTYTDNAATREPNALGFNSGISSTSIHDGTPGPLPPIIHLLLTGVTGITSRIPAGSNVNIWVQVDDLDAQIDLAERRGGNGVREFTIIDTNLLTADLTARVEAELALWSRPIKTVYYTTRDTKTRAGRTVTFNLVHPPITGSYLIQEVSKSEIHEADGLDPKLEVTASSVRFTLDDLLRRVRLDDNANTGGSGSGGSGGTISSGSGGGSGATSVSPASLTVADDGDVTLAVSSGASVAVLADTEITAALSETAVTPGSYSSADITVDSKGRITAAADGSGGGSAITALTGDVTASGPGSAAATIANDAVTNAKAANMAADTLKGRAFGAGTGDPTDLTPNQASIILDGATDPFLRTSATPTGGITSLTGDVTAGPGSGAQAATIANDAVTNAKAANMVQSTLKGRAASAGTGDPTDLTPNQASTILDGATDPFLRTSASSSGLTAAQVAGRIAAGI